VIGQANIGAGEYMAMFTARFVHAKTSGNTAVCHAACACAQVCGSVEHTVMMPQLLAYYVVVRQVWGIDQQAFVAGRAER
jgi:hypothetical protein